MSEHYKSLISDEEVIRILLKESKLRNNKCKDNTRIKPNLNFLQRTIVNNVSANRRISKKQDDFKDKSKKEADETTKIDKEIIDLTTEHEEGFSRKRKLSLPSDIMPVRFVKSAQPFTSQVGCKITNVKGKTIHKVNFVKPKVSDSDSSDGENDKKMYVDSIECNNFVVKSVSISEKKTFKSSLKDSFSKINFVRSSTAFQICNVIPKNNVDDT